MPGEMPNNGEAPGAIIAAEMLKNLVMLNENIQKSHQMYTQLTEQLSDLADYHETYMRAAEILIEKKEEGKSKFSISDFAEALVEAAEEVMGDGDGEEEDEPGDEDPRVRVLP